MAKIICSKCEHLKSKLMGDVETVYWCGISKTKPNGLKLGVYPWYAKPHPKCPLKEKID